MRRPMWSDHSITSLPSVAELIPYAPRLAIASYRNPTHGLDQTESRMTDHSHEPFAPPNSANGRQSRGGPGRLPERASTRLPVTASAHRGRGCAGWRVRHPRASHGAMAVGEAWPALHR